MQEFGGGTPHEPEVDPMGLSQRGHHHIGLVALSLLHLDTSEHMWIHLINSHHPCKTLWSAP